MLFKVGDKFLTPGGNKFYTIESVDLDGNVIIMWDNTGKIDRTYIGAYDVEYVNQCFSNGSWKNIKKIRKEKLQIIKCTSGE